MCAALIGRLGSMAFRVRLLRQAPLLLPGRTWADFDFIRPGGNRRAAVHRAEMMRAGLPI